MQTLSPSLRIGVLRGGPSSEYEVSLKTGANVLKTLSETHRPLDIFISRDGIWHMRGVPQPIEKILPQVDVVVNALHGKFGEDGAVQKILEQHGVLFTGSDSFASAVSMNKILSKQIFLRYKLKTPEYTIFKRNHDLKEKSAEIFRTFLPPVVVKPAGAGSSVGVSIASTPEEIKDAIVGAIRHSPNVLIEEFIAGREATCGVIDDFRGQVHYALPPVEIRPHGKNFFNYDAKYSGQSQEIVPSHFSAEQKKEIERLAVAAHVALGLRHYSRSDFMVSPRGIFILESNSLPGLTAESLLPKSLSAVGATSRQFLHHIIFLALNEK
jgi:D-alanine--D-alanine ligase